MSTGKFFDVAVITEGINGLFSAYELSKTDISIVVIDNYNPVLNINNYKFEYYPYNIISNYEPADVIKELNVNYEVYSNPAYHVILPDRRIDVFSHIQKMIPSAKLRFGSEADLLIDYLTKEDKINDIQDKLRQLDRDKSISLLKRTSNKIRLNEFLSGERRVLKSIYQEIEKSIPMNVFFKSISKYVYPYFESDASKINGVVPQILKKRFYISGGNDGLKKLLLDTLYKRNVNIISDRNVQSINYKRYFNIFLDHSDTIRSRKIILEPIHEKSMSILQNDNHIRKNIKKRFYVDNIFVGIKREALPEGFSRVNNAVLVFNYHHPLIDGNIVFLNANPLNNTEMAGHEMTALSITTLISENSIVRLSAIRDTVLKYMKWFIPFFDEYVDNIYFTEPYILWDTKDIRMYNNNIMMVNTEFLHNYTYEDTYESIREQINLFIRKL